MFKAIGRKLKNLKLRQRMLLVYAIGCFLPLILVTLIMFNSSRRSLTNLQISNEKDRLEVLTNRGSQSAGRVLLSTA